MTPRIVFEDNKILVAEKPRGIPVQADISGDVDLLSSLKKYLKEKYNKPGNVYLGLVHRLDRPVGGVMVFARNSKSAANLSEQIRKRTFKKTYLAVVIGNLRDTKGELRDFLFKDINTNTVKVVSENIANAKEAILNYELIESNEGLSLVKINLKTGRPHQIRVQFANLGNPLYGDSKYGKFPSQRKENSVALWSHEISFLHPGTKENVSFQSTPPKEYPWDLFKFAS